MKYKIALVTDTDNWAFYNRAIMIREKLKDFFDFKIIPATTALNDNILQTILLVQDCDLVHFFWRGLLFSLDNENVVFKRNNLDVNDFIKEKFSKIVKTTCIPDYALLDEENLEKSKKVLNLVDGYYTLSQGLFNIYNELNCQKPQRVIWGGVNTEYFKPENLERFEVKNLEKRKIIIGWSGNSKWGDWQQNGEDLKGIHTILKPVIEKLKKEGYPVELKLADRSIKMIPMEEMKDFYNQIDLYVCVSKTEGGPNPIMESMCCGIPIISTNVGFVNEILGEKQKSFILNERNQVSLKEKIIELINRKDMFMQLSKENLAEAKKCSYDETAKQFKEFFEYNLRKNTK